MALYNLIGRCAVTCSAVRRKTVCKCFTASILVLISVFFIKILIETNVNISNELSFSDVY